MHALLSTSVYCIIRSAPIVPCQRHLFSISHSLRVNYPASCIPHLQLKSPALNQAYPVSLSIKSQCAQYCLLDCTGWFSSVFQAFIHSSHSLCCSLSVLSVYLFSLSQYPLPQCCFVWTWINLRLLTTTIPASRLCTSAQ